MKIKDKNLYLVGGVVRDEILGTTSFDIDYCYEGNAIEFAQKFDIIKTNPDFGTVRIAYNNKEIDIASTRTETYPKAGHLPVINNIACSLKEDLNRRDFTINALAKNTVTEEIIDYHNGLEDIQNQKLRVLHDNSFIDDPSRILRGLKFAIRFNFTLEEHTYELQKKYLDNINYDMSYHRIKKELIETFNLNRFDAYQKFISERIYKLISNSAPLLQLDPRVEKLVTQYNPANIWLIYVGLLDLGRLALNSEEQDIINGFNKIKELKPNNEVDIYNTFKNVPLESIILYASTIDFNIANTYLEKLSKINISINGKHLQELGIQSGKIYSEIFEYITEEKIKNPLLNISDELQLVKKRFL